MPANTQTDERNALAAEVLTAYSHQIGPIRRLHFLAGAGGWSGSLLWRVEAASGQDYCLRRWPAEHPTAERLELIHAVLDHVSRNGFSRVPVPISSSSGTFLAVRNHLWELSRWLPGVADASAQPSAARITAAMKALADFHAGAATFQRFVGIAPTITDRLKILGQLQAEDVRVIDAALDQPLAPELDIRARPLFEAGRAALAHDCWQSLAAHAQDQLPLQPAIRDIHRDHVLFIGDKVSGLIDFGALRIDTPLADVARLIGSMGGADAAARQLACDAYFQQRSLSGEPLTTSERQLIDVLDQTGLILSVFSWLRWLYVERRDMGPVEPIALRWDEIAGRLRSTWSF